MNPSRDSQIDERIVAALSQSVPPTVESGLRAQLTAFRERMEQPGTIAAEAASRVRRRWLALGVLAAAVIAAASIGVFLRTPASLADVTTAVFAKPWIHVRIVSGEEVVGEEWYAPARGVSASRSPHSLNFDDHRLRVHYSYDLAKKTLYRLPDNDRHPPDLEGFVTLLTVLSQQKSGAEQILERMNFLGARNKKLKVLEQRVERVTENGGAFLLYRITVSDPNSGQPVRILFRADDATKLLATCRFEGRSHGKPVGSEMQFSYPETGPADVYALGAPRSAILVDRVPVGDLKRILETIRAGRERMDHYRALFVEQIGDEGFAPFPYVIYRKGDWFRADYPCAGALAPGRPANNENPGRWWWERLKELPYCVGDVMRGTVWFHAEYGQSTNSDGTTHRAIVSVHRTEYNTEPGETYPVDYVRRPEFVCRPPLGVGGQDAEASLDLHPAEGPAGCILLTVRYSSAPERIKNEIRLPETHRFWLDPERDDIVMRWQNVVRDGKGTERITHDQVTEEVAKSPQGVWYATKVRLKNSARDHRTDKSFDQIEHIYVDFSAELPDSLFDPPKPAQ